MKTKSCITSYLLGGNSTIRTAPELIYHLNQVISQDQYTDDYRFSVTLDFKRDMFNDVAHAILVTCQTLASRYGDVYISSDFFAEIGSEYKKIVLDDSYEHLTIVIVCFKLGERVVFSITPDDEAIFEAKLSSLVYEIECFKETVNISITGKPNTGKTFIAAVIQKALLNAGIKYINTDGCSDDLEALTDRFDIAEELNRNNVLYAISVIDKARDGS